MWQMVIQDNFKANKENLFKYLLQIFTAFQQSNINRWRESSEKHFRPSLYKKRVAQVARMQAFVTIKLIENELASGTHDLAAILERQRNFNPPTNIEGTSVAKIRQNEGYRQRRAEKSQQFFQRKRADQEYQKSKRGKKAGKRGRNKIEEPDSAVQADKKQKV